MPEPSDERVSGKPAFVVKSGVYSYEPRSGLAVNGIPRCHKTRLIEHLAYVDPGPALTKKGKPRVRQPPRLQDESAEFYRAQMVHYGLPTATAPTVTREAAKLALSNSALQVPKAVQNVEAKLKAAYDARNDELRRAATEKARANQDSGLAERKKRQRDEDLRASGIAGAHVDNNPSKRVKQTEGKPESKGINLDAICGSYNIQAKVEAMDADFEFSDLDFSLQLALSPQRSHLWGSFDFGIVDGVLRVKYVDDNGTAHFHWCGRDNELGEAEFGPENDGFIQFLPGGKIKGEIEGESIGDGEPINFTGSLCPGTTAASADQVREWKWEYKSLYSENFEFDGPGRWGKNGNSCVPAREIGSDTEESGDEDSESGDSDDYDGFGIRCAFDDDYY